MNKNQIPSQIPKSCTEKFNVRIQPWRKKVLTSLAETNNTSMSKEFLRMMDFFLESNYLLGEYSTPKKPKVSEEQMLFNF
jgi:hypothetical protein